MRILDAATYHGPLKITAAQHDMTLESPAGAMIDDPKNSEAVIGIDGVRAVRAVTQKPLVGIGGITRANCREVMAAGADSVAVIGDLLLFCVRLHLRLRSVDTP